MTRKKKIWILVVTICLLLEVVLPAFAAKVATVTANNIDADVKEEQTITLNLKDNKGIMGFKLQFEYDESLIKIVSVERGTVTQKGSFTDNIGTHKGKFDVLWNTVADVKEDGSLMKIHLKVLQGRPTIKVSYSQEDTFNADWEDVALSCGNISSDSESIYAEDSTQKQNKDKTKDIDVNTISETKVKKDGSVELIDYDGNVIDTVSKKKAKKLLKKASTATGTKAYQTSLEESLPTYTKESKSVFQKLKSQEESSSGFNYKRLLILCIFFVLLLALALIFLLRKKTKRKGKQHG